MPGRHIYIIGIGGVGTVWIADWAIANGWKVSGSDMQESAVTKRLAEAGANIHYTVDPSVIPQDIDEAIINSAITPSSPSYPELQELERRKVPISKRAAWVGKITRQHYTIAVAGTHGKTSTTAMIGWILEQAGLDPTVFVGGTVAAWGGKTRIGQSRYLVIEADEYDRSFHNFLPQIAVLLNVDKDHTDYYSGGMPEIQQSFRRFLRNLPYKKGIVVAYGRDGKIRQVCRGFKYLFRWYDEDHLWPGLKLPQPGIHMTLNATAAAKVAHELGISKQLINKALSTFPGVGRRFEYLGKWYASEVFDDYAHHPREVAASLQALKERYPNQRRTVIFQPHQKARTRDLLKEFGECFTLNSPNLLILAPIYQVAGREQDIQISHHNVAEEIKKHTSSDMELQVAEDAGHLKELAVQAAKEDGILMSMGAGSIRSLVEGWMHE